MNMLIINIQNVNMAKFVFVLFYKRLPMRHIYTRSVEDLRRMCRRTVVELHIMLILHTKLESKHNIEQNPPFVCSVHTNMSNCDE